MKFFIENIQTNPYLYIFGAGNVGRAMYQLGLIYNFNIILIDDRKGFLKKEDFQNAFQLLNGNYQNIVKNIIFLKLSYVIIMTQLHETDQKVLKECLKKNFNYKYLGMVASKKKIAEIRKKLLKEQVTEKKLNTVYSPAGLPIHSKTPDEIALSIMAEIIQVKNSKQ